MARKVREELQHSAWSAFSNVELLYAAAQEFARQRAIEDLMAEMLTHALMASPEDAQRVQRWICEVRDGLRARDPVIGMLNLARG